jgi:hypothetical protein
MKKLLFIGFVSIWISIGIFTPANLVSASPFDSAKEQACKGLEFDDTSTTTCDGSSDEKINSTVTNAINMISLVVGVVAVIMVIVGGLKYVTSQGDSSGVSSAKNTILYAVVGLIIVALAQVIVRFVVNRSTT